MGGPTTATTESQSEYVVGEEGYHWRTTKKIPFAYWTSNWFVTHAYVRAIGADGQVSYTLDEDYNIRDKGYVKIYADSYERSSGSGWW